MFSLGALSKERLRAARPADCRVRGDTECAGLPIKIGCDALTALRAQTQIDPWWAVVSTIMHAGGITYDIQQPFADRIALLSPAKMLDWNRIFFMVDGAQYWPSRAVMLHIGARHFFDYTKNGRDPERILNLSVARKFAQELGHRIRTEGRIEAAKIILGHIKLPCGSLGLQMRLPSRKTVAQAELFGLGDGELDLLTEKATREHPLVREARAAPVTIRALGFGRKSANLLLEYLGDPEAVAVDRHVTYWAFRGVPGKRGGVLKREFKQMRAGRIIGRTRDTGLFARGDEITDEVFDKVTAIVHRAADRCGVEPAALQVAAWAWGVCTTEAKAYRPRIDLFGMAKPIDCAGAFKAERAMAAAAAARGAEKQQSMF